jgi:2-keto-myo-inositol isomerase
MKPCISQATTLPSTFAEDIAAYADAGCKAVEIWLTKLEDHLASNSVADTRSLLSDRGIACAAASFQGGLLQSQGQQRQAHFDHFRRRLDLCEAIGIPTLLVAADFFTPETVATLPRALESLSEAARWAGGAKITLALEFLSTARFCNNLQTALALIEQCGEPNVGVNLDLFHYHVGPSKSEDLRLLTGANLAFVQVCDLSGVLRELARDADRILPGDGDLDFAPLLQRLREIGYNGWVSLELLNPQLWKAKPTQVAELGWMALNRLLGPTPPHSLH